MGVFLKNKIKIYIQALPYLFKPGAGFRWNVMKLTIENLIYTPRANIGEIDQATAQAFKIAEVALKKAHIKTGPESPDYATSLYLQGLAIRIGSGNSETQAQAKVYTERALRIRERILPPYHPDLSRSLADIGSALRYEGDYEGAIKAYQRALEINRKIYNANNPYISGCLSGLANTYLDHEKQELALECYAECLQIEESYYDSNSEELCISLRFLGNINTTLGNIEIAETYYKRELKITELHNDKKSRDVKNSISMLCHFYRKTDREQEAEALEKEYS